MGDDSVLERLELAGRRVPHLRLREETEPAAPPPTGTPGRFEVLGELGRGGIGAVYLSRDRDLGRTVAVKKLLDRHLSSRDIRRRFVGEARIGGRLDHPGVVPIYEVGLEEGRRPFIAMKVVKGRTLAEILDDREGPEDDRRRVLDVFRRVCETVAYAHSRGIVHRDLKPANVMVGTFGEIAVLDWGLAKVLAPDAAGTDDPATDPGELPSGAAEISQDGLVLGTLAYMPPEQARGRTGETDERSDVFALGAMLCEILTGTPPYRKDDGLGWSRAAEGRLEEALDRLATCRADVALADLARACLARDRAERPSGAGALAEAMARHLADAEIRRHRAKLEAVERRQAAARAAARAAEAHAETTASHRRARQVLGLAATIVLLLATAAGGYLLVDAARRERTRTAVAGVDAALRDAERARGAGDIPAALAAVRRAEELAQDPAAGDEAGRRAAGLRGELEEEARCRAVVAGLLADIAEIRTSGDGDWADAFHRAGIDPAAPAPVWLSGRPEAVEVAAGLDAWAAARRRAGEEDRAQDALARSLDPDGERGRLRGMREDAGRLRTFAGSAGVAAPPAPTLVLAALLLEAAGEASAAVDLLRPASLDHADDFFLRAALASALWRHSPESAAEAVAHLSAAATLRPDCAGVGTRLVRLLRALGEEEAAVDAARALSFALLRAGRDGAVPGTVALLGASAGAADRLVLATALARLGRLTEARAALAAAVGGIEADHPPSQSLARLRAEAERALGAAAREVAPAHR